MTNFITIKVPIGPDNRPLASHVAEMFLAVYLDRNGNEVSYVPPQDFETAKFLAGMTLSRGEPSEVRRVTFRIKTKVSRLPAATPPELLARVQQHHHGILRDYPNPRQKMNRTHTKWLAAAERDFPEGVERCAEFRKRKPKRKSTQKTAVKPGKKSSSTGRISGG